MNRYLRQMERGVILVWALITMAVTTTLLGSLGAYYISSGRIARVYMDHTLARFAGLQGVDESVSRVSEALGQVNKAVESMTGDFSAKSAGDKLKKIVEALEAIDNSAPTKVNGHTVKLGVDGYKTLIEDLTKQGKAEVVIRAQVERTGTGAGGIPIQFEQTLTFESDTTQTLTTDPLFDHVYFANNYGRLTSSKIVVNGDVGANADFTLKGATVNGFVKSAAAVTLDGKDPPMIWPRTTYMAKVAAEYDDYFTQTRPTDPIIGSVNSEVYSEPWPGGYDPAVATCPYGFNEKAPTPVDNPGAAPTVPTKPTKPEEPKYEWTRQEYPSKNVEPYKHPTKGTGAYAYPTPKPTKYEYNTRYDSSHDYRYPSAPTSKGSGSKKKWYYTPLGKSKQQKYDTEALAKAAYEADKKTQDGKCDVANKSYREWEQKCEEIDKKWQAECDRRDGLYKAACDAVDEHNKGEAQAVADYQAALKNHEEVLMPKYYSDMAKYESALLAKSDWETKKSAYEAYLAALAAYQELYAKYIAEKSAWESELEGGRQIERLTKETYVESSPKELIVKERVAKIDWPTQLSDLSVCEKYCRDYRMTDTNAVGKSKETAGSLYCANKSKGNRISFTLTGKDKTRYLTNGKDVFEKTVGKEIAVEYSENDVTITRTVQTVDISSGCASSSFVPIVSTVKNATEGSFDAVNAIEAGSVVLIGTSDNPILLNGPVFVPGDVLIRGLVSGRGTIYAGRNIHVIGDISYLNPPHWPHSKNDLAGGDAAKYTPEKVAQMNADNDLLSLVAHGNVIVGDYTSTIWTNATQMACLNLSGQPFLTVSDTDTSVGSKNRNYTELDGGLTSVIGYKEDGSYDKQLDTDYKYRLSLLIYYRCFVNAYYFKPRTRARRFYESVFGGETIGGLKQTSVTSSTPTWSGSSKSIKDAFSELIGMGTGNNVATGSDYSNTANTDAGDVTEIDAVLIANHGIFGVVGGSNSRRFTLNGALICRDEGLLTSFATRFSGNNDAEAWLNWDMRIKSNTREGVRSGLPEKESENESPTVTMRLSDWQQVQ